jgi:anti-sigma factor RsiW
MLDHPFTHDDLIDLQLGELNGDAADALEEHLFECPLCATRLDELHRITAAVREAVASGSVGANVTGAFLSRARSCGLSLREYRLSPGQTVACSAGPEDLFVVRLAAEFAGSEALAAHVEVRDVGRGASQSMPPREVLPDLDRGEVVLVFPGTEVRAYPRSVWTVVLAGDVGGRTATYGPFILDHTP